MASKAAKVLSISPIEFSCLSFDSSSTSKHEVMLTASLSKMLPGKDLSSVHGSVTYARAKQRLLDFQIEYETIPLFSIKCDLSQLIVQIQNYHPIFNKLHDALF